MVSVAGFQEAAVAAAKADDIELFTVAEEKSDWTKKTREAIIKVPFPSRITFDSLTVPGELQHGRVFFEQIDFYQDEKTPPINFSQIIRDVCLWAHDNKIALPCLLELKFEKEFFARLPGMTFYTPIYGLKFELENYQHQFSRQIDIPPKRLKYVYSDIEKQKIFEIPSEDIPIGVDTILIPGKFYTNRVRMKYKCLSVNGDKAAMMLLESKQHRHMLDAEFEMDVKMACHYVPLTDEQEIQRLEARYQSLQQQRESPPADGAKTHCEIRESGEFSGRPVSIQPESLAIMQSDPFYTVRLINRNPDGIALMLRVEDLEAFHKMPRPAAAHLLHWCSPDGTWVIAVGYLINPSQGPSKGGLIFLNPRRAEDYDCILRLFRQNALHIVFLSADLKATLLVEIEYSSYACAAYSQILEKLNADVTQLKNPQNPEHAFEKAKQQFLNNYSIESLLPQ